MAEHTEGEEKARGAPDAGGILTPALNRVRWGLLWEQIWPPVAAIATTLGFFLSVSWLGLWLWLPAYGRAIGLVLFSLAGLAAAFPLIFVRWPGPVEVLRRLDRASGLAHRPATAIADGMAAPTSDPVSLALWREHVMRALRAAKTLKAGWPMPRLVARDPYALRALVLVLTVATFVAASGERMHRITAAFDWRGVMAAANYRVDAWVTPPVYTARAPIILSGLRPGETRQAPGPVSVPAGSVLVIRSSGTDRLALSIKGGLKEAKSDASGAPAGTHEYRFVIDGSGEAVVRGVGARDVSWAFEAIPDQAPSIALTKDPEPQLRGALQLQYKIEDDYGVVDAKANFARKQAADTPATTRPLYDAPDFPLVLPQPRTRNGTAQTTKDLSEHPWAGVDVVLTLTARDEGGNEGRSEPREMRLPERMFTKPLARALIEQRRELALDANAKPHVLDALDALTIAPEKFIPEAGIYLGLRSLFFDLTHARSDDALRDVVARLWSMAVIIEDGNVSDAEAALRAAQEELRQALERGASDEEIKKLTDNLRAALDRFMQTLAEEMRKNPDKLARSMPNTRNIRPQDLKNMIDRMEELSRSGSKDAARRMLEELQSILENLQTARPGASPDGEDDDEMAMLNELGDMIRKQQQLRDRTFQQGQDQRRDRQRAQRGEKNPDNSNSGELQRDQQALRQQLRKMLEEMKKRGMGQKEPGQQGQQGQGEPDQLGSADEAMGDAEGQLGEGNSESAVDSQGRAIESMRKGAQSLAQSMQQQMGQGQGPGRGQPGRNGQQRADDRTDPLGRPLRGRDLSDGTVQVPGMIDTQRARRIIEELRRRYSDPQRPQIELDYIERLLKDF